jgi:hypothetical protein
MRITCGTDVHPAALVGAPDSGVPPMFNPNPRSQHGDAVLTQMELPGSQSRHVLVTDNFSRRRQPGTGSDDTTNAK